MFVTIVYVKSEPISRRTRPAKPALTRAGILDVALRVMRADGLERVTMRRLAAELHTGPASLYVYYANMAELHAAIMDELVAAPVRTDARLTRANWRRSAVRVLLDYTRVLYRYPSLARSAMTIRPSGPNHLRLFDELLRAMKRGGIGPREAAWGLDVLIQLATATACEQSGRAEAPPGALLEHPLADALDDDVTRRHPGLAWAAGDLFSGPGEQRLQEAFATYLTGLAVRSKQDTDSTDARST